MNNIYLLLGSNIGNSKASLAKAITQIEKNIGNVIRQSGLYNTAAWGNKNYKKCTPYYRHRYFIFQQRNN
jgi:7,8-dihydro-6-hydroxymethylpterin-pyrophosphokinase